jgi:hypothetical protein
MRFSKNLCVTPIHNYRVTDSRSCQGVREDRNTTNQARVRIAFQNVRFLEIIMDSSRFGSRDTEIIIAFDMERQLAAYLPPQELRELAWRKARAGAPMDEEDKAAFAKRGFQAKPGMKIYDTSRTVSNALHFGLGLSLADFQLPSQELLPLPADWVRYWHPERAQWMRCSAAPRDPSPEIPELPADMLNLLRQANLGTLKFLGTTLDQAGWGWSAMHFLAAPSPGGMGLNIDMREDSARLSYKVLCLREMRSTCNEDNE